MPFDLAAVLAEHRAQQFDLHRQVMNPRLVDVLATLGFDRRYVRGEGAVLVDDEGREYLDFL